MVSDLQIGAKGTTSDPNAIRVEHQKKIQARTDLSILVTTSVALVTTSVLVTTSKALVTRSDALVPSSFLLLLVRHLYVSQKCLDQSAHFLCCTLIFYEATTEEDVARSSLDAVVCGGDGRMQLNVD